MNQEKKKKVADVLRSLIISSPQKSIPLRKLESDYHDREGTDIPIFEFKTLEDFVRSTGEFIIDKFRGELIISPKPKAGSSHIVKFKDELKESKKKAAAPRKLRPALIPSLPPLQRTIYQFPSQQNTICPRNSPRNTHIVQQRDQTVTVEYTFDQLKSQHTENYRTTNNAPSNEYSVSKRNDHRKQPNQSLEAFDLRNVINEKREKRSSNIVSLHVDQHQKDTHQLRIKTSSHIQPSVQFNRMQDLLENQSKLNSYSNTERKSVQHRLVSARQALSTMNSTKPTIDTSDVQYTPMVQQSTVKQSSPTPQSYDILLFDYCKENGLNGPNFKIFKIDNRFQCSVTINSIRYSCYPTDYVTEYEARIETARYAFDRLNSIRNETCVDDYIKNNYTTGNFSKNNQETLPLTQRQLLPNDCTATLVPHTEFFTNEKCIDGQTVHAVETSKQLPTAKLYSASTSECINRESLEKVKEMNNTIIIPEDNVEGSDITHLKDCIKLELDRKQVSEPTFSRQNSTTSNTTREANGRKIPKFQPPEVNDYFDIEVLMTSTPDNFQIRPKKYVRKWMQQTKTLQDLCYKSRSSITFNMIREGEAYACLHSDGTWYRAIVERQLDSKILVYFCDIGDIDTIADVNKLQLLLDEYRALPRLVINAKLFGILPINDYWEMDDIIEFNRLVEKKNFQATVCKIIDKDKPDDNAVLEIKLIDVSNECHDECINDKLVETGRAMPTH